MCLCTHVHVCEMSVPWSDSDIWHTQGLTCGVDHRQEAAEVE